MSRNVPVLLLTNPADVHGMAVSWALKQWDIKHDIIDFSDFPSKKDAQICVKESGDVECSFGDITGFGPDTYSVIWDRRALSPTVSVEAHEADRRFIRAESKRFVENLRSVLTSGRSRWINAPEAAKVADSKVQQLMHAAKLGFQIPSTLISNNHRAVTEFVTSNDRTIVKQFCQLAWLSEDNKTSYPVQTVEVGLEEVLDPDPVQLCPNIFQPVVEIKYELRVTVIGEHTYAAKIDSQKDGPLIDWRAAVARNELGVEEHNLPPLIAERCVQLCKSLGLEFGCLDLVVTPDDNYFFLEINQSGQWLWKEARDPSIKLLEAFVSHIAELTQRPKGSAPISYDRYMHSTEYAKLLEVMKAQRASYDPSKDPHVMLEPAYESY